MYIHNLCYTKYILQYCVDNNIYVIYYTHIIHTDEKLLCTFASNLVTAVQACTREGTPMQRLGVRLVGIKLKKYI